VARASDALDECGEAPGRADLADEFDRADVDSELERGGGDQHRQLAASQARLETLPPIAREAAVVGGHPLLGEALAEEMRHALGQPPSVDEHERRAVRAHLRGDAVQDLAPLLVRGHGLELAVRHLDGEVEGPAVAEIDDPAGWAAGRGAVRARAVLAGAHEEPRDGLGRPLGRRESDALGARVGQRREALEREGQVRPPLVSRDRVDLIHDHGPHPAQALAAAGGRHEEIERLRCGDQELRRVP
jgi:hypothetical protein